MKNLPPTDPDMFIEINGERIKIKDLPNADMRAQFSYGHFPFHIAHHIKRGIVHGEWPYTPETCLTPDSKEGTWVGERLACPGCGLDCT